MRRRFNANERSALYHAAGGRCEECDVALKPGWHADHVHPWTHGGVTDVLNGAALCPQCNLKKGTKTLHEDPRTRWQEKAIELCLATQEDFLVTACPGAGKTRMALRVARHMLDVGTIDRVIVVAPTLAVKDQWSQEAARFDIDLTAKYKNGDGALPADADGAVTVYPQVASSPKDWRILACRGHRTLVILDEIHHCADEDHTSWGPAMLEAFGNAARRLLLSGTPFRTDGTRIPFVRYDDLGMSISGHGLSYGEAVTLGVVRPIRFEVMNGECEWLKGSQRTSASAASVSDQDLPALMKSLYDPAGRWITSVLRTADDELSRLREEMPEAGGLIVAPSRGHAKAYAKLMTSVCGERVPFVISDGDESPTPIIETFRNSRGRWIVAVDMISEGVDIPRTALVVYASHKRTEMWFRQIVGRCVRRNGDDITATMFVPALPTLVQLAERIEEEAKAALIEAELKARERVNSEQRQFEFDIVIPLDSSEAVLDRVITGGEVISDQELDFARQIKETVGASLSSVHLADLAKGFRLASIKPPVASTHGVLPPTRESGDELRTRLRQRVNFAVNRKARETEVHQKHIHLDLNSRFGDTVPTASVETLEKRLEVLAEWA